MSNIAWEIPNIRVEKFYLKNKLRVTLVKRDYLSYHYRILMDYGYRNEEFPEQIHLLEHMIFKPEEKIFVPFQRMGGDINGYVSMDEFSIYWSVPKNFAKDAVNIASKIFTENPKHWTELMLRREKSVIVREIAEIFSNPARYIYVFIQKKVLGEDAPGTHDPITVDKSFQKITLNDLKDTARNLSPGSAVLSIVGYSNPEILEPLEAWSGNKKSPKRLVPKPEFGFHFREWESHENYIAVAWPSASKSTEDSEILNLLSLVLTAFPTSRLYRKLRLERGLVYYVDSGNVSYIDTGYMLITTSTSPKNTREVIKIILDEVTRIVDEGITEEETRDIINMFFGAIYNLTDSKSGLASTLAYNELFYGDALRIYREIAKKVLNLTPEKIQKIAKQYLQREKAVICVVGKNKFA